MTYMRKQGMPEKKPAATPAHNRAFLAPHGFVRTRLTNVRPHKKKMCKKPHAIQVGPSPQAEREIPRKSATRTRPRATPNFRFLKLENRNQPSR